MSDLALAFANGSGDFVVSNGDLATSDGLESAVILSLFCDARARPDDALPDNTDDPRGWWADTYADQGAAQTGSHLWLLNRAIQTSANVQRAVQYAKEALQWMVDEGVAKSVDVTGEVPRDEALLLHISISKPDGTAKSYRYFFNWLAQEQTVQ